MPKDNVVRLIQPGAFDDQLTDVLRNGARALLAQAVEAEVAAFLAHETLERSGCLKPATVAVVKTCGSLAPTLRRSSKVSRPVAM